jgi:hypothetical protein
MGLTRDSFVAKERVTWWCQKKPETWQEAEQNNILRETWYSFYVG